MSPEVARAVDVLREEGRISAETADILRRVARRELLSIHAMLRAMLYGGVLVTMAGVGILVQRNLERIGPVTIALGLALAAGGCLTWVARRAAPFTWGEVEGAHLGLDYLLMLGVLLAGADLAYLEVQFTPLGASWPWHLLLASLLAGTLAVRYDSRVVFSVALSSFAAWRGVSVSYLGARFWSGAQVALRANAIGCGVLFVLLALAMEHRGAKPHFAPISRYMGWMLVLGGMLSGVDASSDAGRGWALLLLATGLGLGTYALWRRHFGLFGFGLLGAYAGLTALMFRVPGFDDLAVYWFFLSAAGILAALLAAHHFMKEPA